MTPAERYRVLQAQMMRGRAFGTLSEGALDAILDEMDVVWASMSAADCAAADAEAAAVAA